MSADALAYVTAQCRPTLVAGRIRGCPDTFDVIALRVPDGCSRDLRERGDVEIHSVGTANRIDELEAIIRTLREVATGESLDTIGLLYNVTRLRSESERKESEYRRALRTDAEMHVLIRREAIGGAS